ncbi:hypothetical protein MHTCC0001_15980 [Flavobacteriaceae bacterium MHTCC 0001]
MQRKTMKVFTNEDYGELIGEQLSKYLKKTTDVNDRVRVHKKTGVGTSTIRDVVYRRNRLTKDNAIAIVELIKIAKQNCDDTITSATEMRDMFESMITGRIR